MLAKETLHFLKKLEKNNNREWFQANKDAFVKASDNIVALAGQLIDGIAKFDSEAAGIDPKACLFRIYRDVRFSKDKSPYKTNLGAFISPGGRKLMAPGYYFHIQPGQFFAAAGKHLPDPAELLKIRNAIANRTAEFLKIVESKKFHERFGDFDAERLSKPPKGFSADSPTIEYLKLKSFTISESFSENEALSHDYPKRLLESFKASYPLVVFLREALR